MCERGARWSRATFSRLENVIFITLIKFKLFPQENFLLPLTTLSTVNRAGQNESLADGDGLAKREIVFFFSFSILIIIKNYQKQAIKSRPRDDNCFLLHDSVNLISAVAVCARWFSTG